MGILQETNFLKCMIILSIFKSSSGLMIIQIEPLEFKCSSCCEPTRKRCVSGEDEHNPFRPVFEFQLQLNNEEKDCRVKPKEGSGLYCPYCNYTEPFTCENKDISERVSPIVIMTTNKIMSSMNLLLLITHGNRSPKNVLHEDCFISDNITSLRDTPTKKSINDSCFSLDFNISIICAEYFYGHNCDIECRRSKNSTTGFYECDGNGNKVCLTGWMGDNCTEVDRCANNPCENNGTCSQNDTEYICNCTEEFSGLNCSIPQRESTTPIQNTEIYRITDASPFNPTKTTLSIIAGGVVLVIAIAVLLNLGLKRRFEVMKMTIEI